MTASFKPATVAIGRLVAHFANVRGNSPETYDSENIAQETIRFATDGHSIRIFVRRASDYLIGGTYEVPSGLGGTFRVILKDACNIFAIVQNYGNCEDLDAMQPYRVPLDALTEIDDRRVA